MFYYRIMVWRDLTNFATYPTGWRFNALIRSPIGIDFWIDISLLPSFPWAISSPMFCKVEVFSNYDLHSLGDFPPLSFFGEINWRIKLSLSFDDLKSISTYSSWTWCFPLSLFFVGEMFFPFNKKPFVLAFIAFMWFALRETIFPS